MKLVALTYSVNSKSPRRHAMLFWNRHGPFLPALQLSDLQQQKGKSEPHICTIVVVQARRKTPHILSISLSPFLISIHLER